MALQRPTLEEIYQRIKADMADLRRASETKIESELLSFSNSVSEQIKEYRNEVDSSLRVLGQRVESDSGVISEMLRQAGEDMTEWQEK